MSSQPSSLLILTGAFSKPLNAGNTAAGITNPDGTSNVSGTDFQGNRGNYTVISARRW